MQRIMLKSKLHRARVTATEIEYEGSIAIDEDLLERVGIMPLEQVHIFNINSGAPVHHLCYQRRTRVWDFLNQWRSRPSGADK